MNYMGSKRRIAKHILPIIIKDKLPDQWYVEPFVGGGNMIENVDGCRIGADSNECAISALRFIRDGELPKNNFEFTEAQYVAAKENYKSGSVGVLSGVECYALIAFSFGAKMARGWARGISHHGNARDYVMEQYKSNSKQQPKLKGVKLITSGYADLEIPPQSIIYCDPPYAGVTGYKDKFDSAAFFEWCRGKVKQGHKVFISEYNAPDDFACVWSAELVVSIRKKDKETKAVEKLFVHRSQLSDE